MNYGVAKFYRTKSINPIYKILTNIIQVVLKNRVKFRMIGCQLIAEVQIMLLLSLHAAFTI